MKHNKTLVAKHVFSMPDLTKSHPSIKARFECYLLHYIFPDLSKCFHSFLNILKTLAITPSRILTLLCPSCYCLFAWSPVRFQVPWKPGSVQSLHFLQAKQGFPGGASGKNPSANAGDLKKCEVWSLGQEDPLEKGMKPIPVFLPGTFHGQRSLVGYGP